MEQLPPLNETQWQDVFSKYQQFPEYQKINTDMSLSEFKAYLFLGVFAPAFRTANRSSIYHSFFVVLEKKLA